MLSINIPEKESICTFFLCTVWFLVKSSNWFVQINELSDFDNITAFLTICLLFVEINFLTLTFIH